MKKINLTSILVAAALLMFTNFNAQAGTLLGKKDCSNYKKLSHEWNACHLGSEKYPPVGADSVNASSEKKEKEKKKKDGILSIFKKLREAGGKNIGEPG